MLNNNQRTFLVACEGMVVVAAIGAIMTCLLKLTKMILHTENTDE